MRLAPEDVLGLSPQFLPLHCRVPTIVAAGGGGAAAVDRAVATIRGQAVGQGADVRLMDVAGLHHFSITHSLSDSNAPLTRAILDLVHR